MTLRLADPKDVHPMMRITPHPTTSAGTVDKVVVREAYIDSWKPSQPQRTQLVYIFELQEGSFFAVREGESVWVVESDPEPQPQEESNE